MTPSERTNLKNDTLTFLENAMTYLGDLTFSKSGKGLTLGQWFNELKDARDILAEAKAAVQNEPEVITLLVVDADAFERRLIAAAIADDEVQRLFPALTSIGAGSNFFHIVNESSYPVETKAHVIPTGVTLCGRSPNIAEYDKFRNLVPTCPGCLAKAKNVMLDSLADKFPNVRREKLREMISDLL